MAGIKPPSITTVVDAPASTVETPTSGSVCYEDAQEGPFTFPAAVDDYVHSAFEMAAGQEVTTGLQEKGEMRSSKQHGHARKPSALALPAFNFNPGSEVETSGQHASPPASPHSPASQPSPSKRGHRRLRSELGGGSRHQSPMTTTGPVVDKLDEELKNMTVQDPSSKQPPTRGHRHRRSGAVSSRDLSNLSKHDIFGDDKGKSTPNSPTFAPPQPGTSSTLPANDIEQLLVNNPEGVEIGERKSLPTLKSISAAPALRPAHSSDGTTRGTSLTPSEYLSSVRPATVASAFPTSWPAMAEPPSTIAPQMDAPSQESLGHFPSVSIVEEANDDIMTSFDVDDYEGSPDDDFYGDPNDDVELSEFSSFPSSPQSPTFDTSKPQTSDSVIDLDDANDLEEPTPLTANDMKTLRLKSFSAARRSMHSGGSGDFVEFRAGIGQHRRSESAPSSALPFFSEARPSSLPRQGSQTAAEKGFEIQNVFEEDEEDSQEARAEEEAYRQVIRRKSEQSFGLGIKSSTSPETLSLVSVDVAQPAAADSTDQSADDERSTPTPTNDADIPSRSHTIRGPSSNRTSVIHCKPEADSLREANVDEEEAIHLDQLAPSRPSGFVNRPASQPLPRLTAPPWNSHQPSSSFGSTPQELSSSSTWSTPKLDTAATSLHEAPQINLQAANFEGCGTSSEGVVSGIPSLVSSRSTVSAQHNADGSSIPPTTPNSSRVPRAGLTPQSQAEKRRKRSSIASIHQLLRGGKSELSVGEGASSRATTPSGVSDTDPETTPKAAQAKESRIKRITKAARFWKSKENVQA